MKHLMLLLLVAFSLQWGYAQNTLSGTITNKEDMVPLDQVSIYLPELEKGTSTNDQGEFEIGDLPKGEYILVISYIGFETFSKSVPINKGVNTLNVALTPSVIEMQEVIVSTPFHKLQSENVMKVERANMKGLKTSGALTLTDGITHIAGVENVSTGMGIGKPVIRGLSANRVLVYTQGIRMENQQFGAEHGLGINGAGLESVEVIKGPASLLYGSDAMGGVLYFNPEKFANVNTTEGDVNMNYFSNTQGLSTDAGIRTSQGRMKFLLRGSYASHIDYKTGNGSRVTNSRFKEYDLKTGLGYQSTQFKTELRYNYTNSDFGIPEEIGEQSTERSPELPYQEIANHILSSKSKFFLRNSTIEAILGYIFNNRKEFEDSKENAALEMHLSTFNYNLQYDLPKWGNLETIIGLQGMHQTNENFGEEEFIPDATTNDIGILATSHIHFKDESGMQLGLRFDRRNIRSDVNSSPPLSGIYDALDRDFNSFNAAIGYKFNLTPKSIARLNLATGFRAPNLAELTSDGVHEGTNRYEIGDPNLDNEQNIQADISWEYNNKHFEFYVNGFYNAVEDFIYIGPTGEMVGENQVFVYQQENAKLYGGELGFHLHPHPLDWLHLESSFETVVGKQDNSDYLPLIPANSLTNTIRVEFINPKKWVTNNYAFVSLKSVFRQDKVGNFEDPSAGYNLVDLGAGGDVMAFNTKVEVRVSAQNIFDTSYIAHLSRLKSDGIPNIGRNISLALSIPF
ncbi:TonB-dependent receptor [Maribacter arenosus]|uniref:TonB-dependent receptor n=1 Tax=Maribacter arenosus TaxID=1854708 RepID=A0ABR7VA10_9FLAO|nr:TonB-dependent receptor [Maribacter arenosus]MBD0849387.1 TonB-dependent receptor [Maribacter arenosus]